MTTATAAHCADHTAWARRSGAGCHRCVDGTHVVVTVVSSSALVAWVQPNGSSPVRVRRRPGAAQPWRCDEHGAQDAPNCVHTTAAQQAVVAYRSERSATA